MIKRINECCIKEGESDFCLNLIFQPQCRQLHVCRSTDCKKIKTERKLKNWKGYQNEQNKKVSSYNVLALINKDKPLGGYENEKLNKKLNNLEKTDVIDNLKKEKRESIPLAGDKLRKTQRRKTQRTKT